MRALPLRFYFIAGRLGILRRVIAKSVHLPYGERLFALAPEPKRFVRLPPGRHENLEDYGVVTTMPAFLDEPSP